MDTEPVSDSDKPKDTLQGFVEHSGMDLWELVVEQRNLNSLHDTLYSLKTTAAEILHLNLVELVMETICRKLTLLEQNTPALSDILMWLATDILNLEPTYICK
jgi:hypothetical protein